MAVSQMAASLPALSAARAGQPSFGSAPDRGELFAYVPDQVRHDGAYTWYRTALSEAHAMRAMAEGHLRVTGPDGTVLDYQYDRHIEHPSGDWTWIGHVAGTRGEQAILTFGAQAAYGSLAQPGSGKLPLRLTVRNGASWLVETDARKLAGVINAATRPQEPDYFIVPRPLASTATAVAASVATVPAPTAVAAGASAGTTVDVVIGYTPGFAADHGGDSGAVTRINYLVDLTNTAYQNSQINARVRLVKTLSVNYTDSSSNDSTLEQLSGYKAGVGKTTPAAAFNALRAARQTYGADLVSLVRKFKDPEHAGCGIAWLIGGGKQAIQPGDGWDYFGYSVVSDGTDAGTDGKTYFCLDQSLAHEFGHNMGAAHDRDTAMGDDGVLDDPDDYGAFPYSFGYKSPTYNFYTVMAYGDAGQKIYTIFSNPRSTFCGTHACGVTGQADNAYTLSQTIPTIATFRATVVPATAGRAHNDFDGDGRSDILWRNGTTGADVAWKAGNSASTLAVATVADANWRIVGAGDFNGDGKSDAFWRNFADGSNAIWFSANSSTRQSVTTLSPSVWVLAGIGDFNGDGRDDVLWRNQTNGSNVIWRSGSSATTQAVAAVSSLSWKVVAVADFNGDRKADILWRNSTSGADAVWYSANIGTSANLAAVSSQDWKVVGAADFDGDGKADILWRNGRSGADAIWKSGNSATTLAISAVSSLDWTIAGVGDFNADARGDVLWRNTRTGANTIWLSGNFGTSQAVATLSDQAWKIVP